MTRLALPPLAYFVARYIEFERAHWRGRGTPLSHALRDELGGYFATADLERTRIVENVHLPIPNPPGYAALRRWTGLALPDPAEVAAITFDDVILARRPVWDSLLFHEMVHVTQFRLMGVQQFSESYVRGFLDTLSYEAIPLEACAFELEALYAQNGGGLDVEAEVRRRLNIW